MVLLSDNGRALRSTLYGLRSTLVRAPAAGSFPGLFTPVLGLLSPVVRAANITGCLVERGLCAVLLTASPQTIIRNAYLIGCLI